MRGAVRGLLIFNYVWLLLVFLLLVFAAIPAIPGAVIVRTPGEDGWKTTVTNDTVIMTGNVSIHNGGFFAFNNFYFVIMLYDENGSDLASFSSNKTNLLPGLWMDIPVTFFVNKSRIGESVLEALLRSEVTFASLVFFNTNYLFDFRVQAGYRGNMTVGPLIKDLDVDLDNSTLQTNGTAYELSIPYSFSSSGVMAGNTLNISGTIGNDTSMLGSLGTTVELGKDVNGTLIVRMSKDAYDHLSTEPDHLTLDLLLGLNDISWKVAVERDWVPPSQRGT